MRLKKEQIQKISERVLDQLEKSKQIVAKADRSTLLQKIEQVITANFHTEDRLDEEAKALLDKFRRQVPAGSINEHEMFQKIKKQLAKDKKFVI
ncbi:DUF507 family protein [bacterium]|nr:MAG: DUF507 family protein [bacterium]